MEQDNNIAVGAIAVLVLVYVAVIGLSIWATVRIIQKAGYSGWWALMGFVPIANIVMVFLFAFKEWPVRQELAYLRGYAAATGLPGYAPQAPYPYGRPLPGVGEPPVLPPSGRPWGEQQDRGSWPPEAGGALGDDPREPRQR